MEAEGELFYSPPHYQDHDEATATQHAAKGDSRHVPGEATLLLCLARERQISANLRKALDNRDAKVAATQKTTTRAAEAQDVALLNSEKTLLERRLQQEKRQSSELRRDALTKSEENGAYKRSVTTGLKRLRDLIQRERWQLSEHGDRASISESPLEEVTAENAEKLLERELDRLNILCRAVQEKQLKEMRQRSQADRSISEREIKSLTESLASQEVCVEARNEDDEGLSQIAHKTLEQECQNASEALDYQKRVLESTKQDLERSRRDSADQNRLIETLRAEMSKLQSARANAIVEITSLTEKVQKSQEEFQQKESESLKRTQVRFSSEVEDSIDSPPVSPDVGLGRAEDLFILPHRPRPRPKSDGSSANNTTKEIDEVTKPPTDSQKAERPRKKSKILFQTPMIGHEETIITRTRSQTLVRTDSTDIQSDHPRDSPTSKRKHRKNPGE